jgi:hypothetical protein
MECPDDLPPPIYQLLELLARKPLVRLNDIVETGLLDAFWAALPLGLIDVEISANWRLQAALKHVCYRQLPDSFNTACWLSVEGRQRLELHRLWQTDAREFIPTQRQQQILDLLNGHAKKLAQLANKLGVQPSTLSGRDLKELKLRGRVRHDKRVGYWRPDAPPPHLAVTSR